MVLLVPGLIRAQDKRGQPIPPKRVRAQKDRKNDLQGGIRHR